jgi:hypothetical protein
VNPLLQLGLVVGAYLVGKTVVTMVRRRKPAGPDAAAVAADLRRMALCRAASEVAAEPYPSLPEEVQLLWYRSLP